MKPIDGLTGLPRSADLARMVAAQGRHGEVQTENQAVVFSKEMNQRAQTVNEPPKAENSVDGESAGGSAAWEAPSDKGGETKEGETPGSTHPSKGKLLDIQGA